MVTSVSETGKGNRTSIEYRCDWDNNPEATAHILVAHARAAYWMYKEGKRGALTILDIPPAYLNVRSGEELRRCFM
jgi:diaminopimelate dehydrogenase